MPSEFSSQMNTLLSKENETKRGYENIIQNCIDEGIIGNIKFLWEQKKEHIEELTDLIASMPQ